jgi:hypothetical protein
MKMRKTVVVVPPKNHLVTPKTNGSGWTTSKHMGVVWPPNGSGSATPRVFYCVFFFRFVFYVFYFFIYTIFFFNWDEKSSSWVEKKKLSWVEKKLTAAKHVY